jgi:hypothetical protein
MLSLTEAAVCDLQLVVLIRRRKCTTVEKSILLLELVRDGDVVLIVCGQTHTLLHDSPSGVILQVEQVLCILGHHSHASTTVRALKARYGLKVLLPHCIFLIPNREMSDRHHGDSGEVTLSRWGECDVGRLLNGGGRLTADDGPCPRILLVEGYRHTGLTYVPAIGHRKAAVVDRDFPVIAEMEECVVEHSPETRAMLAHRTKPPILGEEEVGVVIQAHLKTQPQKHYWPQTIHLEKIETEICIKANSSKEKEKMELFLMDSVLELNTKILGNNPIFLSITHITLSIKRFGCYDVSKFDFAAEFCFWPEQRLNRAQLLGLGLTETLEVLNTITVGNSLSFPMVHYTAPIGCSFMSYDCQKLDRLAETKSGQTIDFGASQDFDKISS